MAAIDCVFHCCDELTHCATPNDCVPPIGSVPRSDCAEPIGCGERTHFCAESYCGRVRDSDGGNDCCGADCGSNSQHATESAVENGPTCVDARRRVSSKPDECAWMGARNWLT